MAADAIVLKVRKGGRVVNVHAFSTLSGSSISNLSMANNPTSTPRPPNRPRSPPSVHLLAYSGSWSVTRNGFGRSGATVM